MLSKWIFCFYIINLKSSLQHNISACIIYCNSILFCISYVQHRLGRKIVHPGLRQSTHALVSFTVRADETLFCSPLVFTMPDLYAL